MTIIPEKEPDSTSVNLSYGNGANAHNPVFQDIIERLINSGLYNSNLTPGSTARIGDLTNNIQNYANADGLPNTAIALEVLSDCISRAILYGFQKGFEQGTLKHDSASVIQFKTDTLTEDLSLLGLNLSSTTNVHEAIVNLGQELAIIKTSLASLGYVIPPQPVIKDPVSLNLT